LAAEPQGLFALIAKKFPLPDPMFRQSDPTTSRLSGHKSGQTRLTVSLICPTLPATTFGIQSGDLPMKRIVVCSLLFAPILLGAYALNAQATDSRPTTRPSGLAAFPHAAEDRGDSFIVHYNSYGANGRSLIFQPNMPDAETFEHTNSQGLLAYKMRITAFSTTDGPVYLLRNGLTEILAFSNTVAESSTQEYNFSPPIPIGDGHATHFLTSGAAIVVEYQGVALPGAGTLQETVSVH
jgi:hypothetical protein